MKKIISIIVVTLTFASFSNAQIPTMTHIQILKAEDARRYDKTLEDLMKSPNAEVRKRAALAAGRIGREEAIPSLTTLLTTDSSDKVRTMAAFALGEIESIKAADVILKTLETRQTHDSVRARTIEAAGKIAAANPKDEQSKELGAAILKAVDFEAAKRSEPSTEIMRLGMTAILRAKPSGGEETARKFLHYTDPNIVADALNTLARLRVKNANVEARELLKTHTDPTVRANAARVLGAAEDKDALDILLNAATTDTDSRVRVSSIRALSSLNIASAGNKLVESGNKLLKRYEKSLFKSPSEQNELLEIVSSLSKILAKTKQQNAAEFVDNFVRLDGLKSPEVAIAKIRIAGEVVPGSSVENSFLDSSNWRVQSTLIQMFGEATRILENDKEDDLRKEMSKLLMEGLDNAFSGKKLSKDDQIDYRVIPEFLRSLSLFKPKELDMYLGNALISREAIIRATAAEILGDQPKSKENVGALKEAFVKAIITDKHDNDAQLAILDALYKLDKKESVGTLLSALNATDYLVRKKAFELLRDKELQKDVPSLAGLLDDARKARKDQVLPYNPKAGTKLGQVLNTDADYRRAGQRKNGSVKALVTTEKGTFTIDFYPEDAPLTVDNFIKLARSKYFDGLEVHRVVPNFVMQDGDPRGDGNGGPGWSIRCELNMIPYDRGAVGMALSGKDTGGSQWFVTHSPQPHLDGGYTVFGHVNESDMKVVEAIVRGDRVLTVRIIGI